MISAQNKTKHIGKTQIKTYINNHLYEITFHIVSNFYISCDALIDSNFLDNIVTNTEKGVITIIRLFQNSD